MTNTPEPDAKPPRTLTERAAGRPSYIGEVLSNASRHEERLAAAVFMNVKTKRGLFEGIETGAGAAMPLAVVHGFVAFVAAFKPDLPSLIVHGGLTGLAIMSYYAVLHGRTIWPSVFLLIWLSVEIVFGSSIFGYRMGASIFNLVGLAFAVLGIRASWRRAQLAKRAI